MSGLVGFALLHLPLQFLHCHKFLMGVHVLTQSVHHGVGAFNARVLLLLLEPLRLSNELRLVDRVNVVFDALEAREGRRVVLQ